RDFVAELDDIFVVLRERIVNEAEMTTTVRAGVKLQVVHDALDAPVAELLARHLKGAAERAVVRAAADEGDRPVLRTRGAMRAPVEPLLTKLVRGEVIPQQLMAVELLEIDKRGRHAA